MRILGHTPAGLEIVSCGLCDADDARVRVEKFGLKILQCRRCGFWYVGTRYTKAIAFERYSPRYFEEEYLPSQKVINGQVDHDFNDGKHADLLRLLEATLGRTGRLFEIGAGAGLFLVAAVHAGWQASGVELSEAGVAFGRQTLGVDIEALSAEDVPDDRGPFDAVVMLDVIEHLFDTATVLAKARSLLHPGGVLMVLTPNIDALSRRALGAEWAILSPQEHLSYYSERTLRRALQSHGFGDVRFDRCHRAWSLYDTMNPYSTHQPGSERSVRYERGVTTYGPKEYWLTRLLGHGEVYRAVQAAGLGDMLLATARAK